MDVESSPEQPAAFTAKTPPSNPGVERRQNPRIPFAGEATIIRCDRADRTPVLVQIRDVSSSGIAITHTARLLNGERFIAVLPPAIGGGPRGVLCTVVHSWIGTAGEFLIGARFSGLVKPAGPVVAQVRTPAPVPPAAPQNPQVLADATAAPILSDPPNAPVPPTPRAASADLTPLLTRDQCIQRAEHAMQARTLSGVVAQVIALAASPRSDMADLAMLVARDPMLSARILQAANSVSYTSTRGMVSTIPEAVRNVGCATVRNIAASLGVFDAMPPSAAYGFNPIRCWQHSFAVATLNQRLAGDSDSGLAYLSGLCHDLGEILFQTHFGCEFLKVLEVQAVTGQPREVLERKMLGMSHGELVVTILRCLGLPDAIREPIEAFHSLGGAGHAAADRATRRLRMADTYANGLLLASSTEAPILPLTRAECRSSTGNEQPPRPDGVPLRSEIFSLTAILGRLSSKDEAALIAPIYPHKDVRVWLTRESAFSSFDPVAAGVEWLSEVTVQDRYPTRAELADHRGIVIISRSTASSGRGVGEFAKLLAELSIAPTTVLWLVGRVDGPVSGPVNPVQWPIPISTLADFIVKL